MVVSGIIRPPPEIRAVADRTASYVAKNGRAFEDRILKSDKGKAPKFGFLQPDSPFHAYYEDKINFYINGGDDEAEKKKAEEAKAAKLAAEKSQAKAPPKETARKKEKTQKASAIDPIAKALLAQRAKINEIKTKHSSSQDKETSQSESQPAIPIPPPSPLEMVSIVAPSNVSQAQLETIQLVAQMSAMDGKGGSFLHQLSTREWNNPEFFFCQPRHAHFAYFSALVDAYRRILGSWTAAANNANESGAKQPTKATLHEALDDIAYRVEFNREMEKQQRSQEEEGEVTAIDWHDFVVVETIDFPADEKVELGMFPPPPPPPSKTTNGHVASMPTGDDMDESDEEGETLRVVHSYTPKVVGTANPHEARAIDPITGRSVAVADMPEHMRIQLLDPKWAEERKKFQDKQKDSNLVGGDAIASNLSRFSQARGDMFGKSVRLRTLHRAENILSLLLSNISHVHPSQLPQEQELLDTAKVSKRRLEEANRIIRDQASQTGPAFPPQGTSAPASIPGYAATAPNGAGVEPMVKRMRVGTEPGIPPPPPPPPGPPFGTEHPPTTVVPPPPPMPANQAPSVMEQSSNPMADALLPNNSLMAPESAPAAKTLLSEADFRASLNKPEVILQIRIPNDSSQMAWNFYGQILSLSVDVMSKIKDVKADLSRTHLNGMPVNKMQFKDPSSGFLNNNQSLAALNIGPTATLELVPKTRGGRR